MNIKGKIVTLRAITKTDAQLIVDMFNDSEIENLVIGWAFPLSIEQQNAWIDKMSSTDNKNFRFIIETPGDGAIGIATLTDIDWKNGSASHGIKIVNKANRAKGIGTDTVMAIMRYAFDELRLHRLNGSWFNFNTASRHMYMKCGWKEEGIKREAIYKGGEWRDLTITGILESEYRQLVTTNNYWGGG